MTEIPVKSSSSDSSTDSWTVLDDNSAVKEQNAPKHSESNDEIFQSEILNENKESQIEERNENNGFLSFDEFLQERLLQHDYEHAEKPQKMNFFKIRKGGKKQKAHNMGIPVFITIILALTAFATLCSTLSQPQETKEKTNTPIQPKPTKHKEAILKEINKTLNEIEKTNPFKLAEQLENRIKNKTKQQCSKEEGPSPKPKFEISIDDIEESFKLLDQIESHFKDIDTDKFPKVTIRTPKPELLPSKKRHDFFPKANKVNSDTETTKTKNIKSKWIALKQILLDTNVHALFSLIMTNVYLFTLLADLCRRSSYNCNMKLQLKRELLEDLEKNGVENMKKLLFKELPFNNEEISEKSQKKKKVQKTKSISKAPVLEDNKNKYCFLFRSCPFLPKKTSVFPLLGTSSEETGKSECQRRFDELDLYQRKFQTLKQTQRNRIKLLKQKFKNEVTHIRDTEEESAVRAEKINRTSQRFIKKLKFNREKYLLELKKVKELRQKVAESKKDNVKNVGIGSYSVALPTIYDYGEKFKMIKEKFERENNQLPREWKFQ